MAGDSNENGKIFLRKNEKRELIGYSDSTIAELLGVNTDIYLEAKAKMMKYNKIKITKNNVIIIVNWDKYQSEYKRQRPYRDKVNSNSPCNESNALDIDKDKERDKEEEKEKDKKEKPPSWLPKEEFNEYKKMRMKIRKPMTPKAESLAIRKLEKLKDNGDNPKEVLEQSIMNSWAGLFPLKDSRFLSEQDNSRKGAIEREDEIIRLAEEGDEEYKDLAEEIKEKRRLRVERWGVKAL